MPTSRNPKGVSKPQARQVNTLLHTLRGEQFRHEQNLQRSKDHLIRASSSFHLHNNPTLPFAEIYDNAERTTDMGQRTPTRAPTIPPVRINPGGMLEYAYPRGEVPGPPIPKSWSGLFGKGKDGEVDERAHRAEALSLIFSHLPPSAGSAWVNPDDGQEPSVLPLTLLCLRVLLSACSTEQFAEEIVPCVPSHLRRDFLRWAAVHCPQSNPKLFALCYPEGHADGELIIVGPQASLPHSYLKPEATERPYSAEGTSEATDGTHSQDARNGTVAEEDWSWDSPVSHGDLPPPLTALVLFNIPLPVSTLFTFPPTLTHLALLALPFPAPVYRLTSICPLLEVLDLSFNPWLGQSHSAMRAGTQPEILDRVEWSHLGRLRLLGLRGCGVSVEIVRRVNLGRWVDVDVVGLGPRTTPSPSTG